MAGALCRRARTSTRLLCRTQLPQQAKLVGYPPMLGHPLAVKQLDIHLLDVDPALRRRQIEQWPGVGALHPDSNRNAIALRHHVLNREAKIGEGRTECRNDGLEPG